jgi:hypothetical protein
MNILVKCLTLNRCNNRSPSLNIYIKKVKISLNNASLGLGLIGSWVKQYFFKYLIINKLDKIVYARGLV